MAKEGLVELIPDSESFSRDALLACYSARRLTAIPGIKSIKAIRIPAAVESIGERCFYECSNLVSVTFVPGSSLKRIEKEAFRECKNLREMEIPAGVKEIGDCCFSLCAGLFGICTPSPAG